MKNLSYLGLGVVFGLALTKGEAISWFRIQEMFHFQSIHMYGIFMTAVPVGAISLFLLRRLRIRTLQGDLIQIPRKPYHHGVIIGGLIFGFGWALTGACPGPLYAQIGGGYLVTIITFISALAGTWVYALMLPLLPD
ncbi:MAG: YeeE/YedE family protein [Cyclobacteriaceae bacterium]|nr:YeeE/YedE family protein [Cyclobacteriaceae bacterium]MDH4296206.1 YeeE/YedE family protein [Cyclobacteriaceae bacterium]MDH5250711.1 YeeE/YedE family protein [Cyclobacteriaceae bacterium]